jgi:hypothetical protein
LNDYAPPAWREEFYMERRRDQQQRWYDRTRDPRFKPPIDVPPAHCRGDRDCDAIGRGGRRW